MMVTRVKFPAANYPFIAPFVHDRPGRAAYINDELASVAPTHREPGPGFDWVHVPFAAASMIHKPGEHDHRLAECAGECKWLHDWPTAGVTHTRMTFPAPLFAAFQDLFDHEKGLFGGEDYYMCEHTDDGASWYGLDLPDVSSV